MVWSADRSRSGRYRQLLTGRVVVWSLVVIGSRLPVAMAPLAVVFLVRERPGAYALGAVLAAAYVAGEVVGAALLGPRLRLERARVQLGIGLGIGAVAFAGLALLPQAHPLLLGALAIVAGAAPAAAPGGLRALLVARLPEPLVVTALSLESFLSYLLWTVAPALTVVLALHATPAWSLAVAGGLMAASAAGLWALPAGSSSDGHPHPLGVRSMLQTLSRAWPIYVTTGAAMALMAIAELTLPALLAQRGIAVGWTAPLLAAYAVAAALGAILYGARASWPGRFRTQSLMLLLVEAACMTLVATLAPLAAIAGFLLLAGVLAAGVQVSRTMQIRAALPPTAHPAGYSMMYAVGGIGYAASASVGGAVQAAASASVAILAGVTLTVLLTATAALGELLLRPTTPTAAKDTGPSGPI